MKDLQEWKPYNPQEMFGVRRPHLTTDDWGYYANHVAENAESGVQAAQAALVEVNKRFDMMEMEISALRRANARLNNNIECLQRGNMEEYDYGD